jgi:hypothetical protein
MAQGLTPSASGLSMSPRDCPLSNTAGAPGPHPGGQDATLLNCLAAAIPGGDSVVSAEQVFELPNPS